MERATSSLEPSRTRAEELTEDLPEPLETEIIETADKYVGPEDRAQER